MDIESFKEELVDFELDYNYHINVPSCNFGIEIEYGGALFSDVTKGLNRVLGYPFVYEYWFNKPFSNKYSLWALVDDPTVTVRNRDGVSYGGEVNSRILSNDMKSWNELELVCDFLSGVPNVEINDCCSVHVHTSSSIYSSVREYVNLLKLWIVYEDIIYRFGFGFDGKPRRLLFKYAGPLGGYLHDKLDLLDSIDSFDDLNRFFEFKKKFGLNLTNVLRKSDYSKDTIEVRIYNGTLDKHVIQNIVLFNENLLEYATSSRFDSDFINYKINNYEKIFINDAMFDNSDVIEFSELLFSDEIDRLRFLKQYFKAYRCNEIEKVYHL